MDDRARAPPGQPDGKKKSLTAAERERPEVQKKREEFTAFLAEADPQRLIFLDESGSHIGMTRTHARAPRGRRAVGIVPRNRGRVVTMLGAMSLDGMEAMMLVQGGTTAAVFETFVREHLGPRLRPGDFVIMDNLGAHHAAGIRELIESYGATPVYLPPYSPDSTRSKAGGRCAEPVETDDADDGAARGVRDVGEQGGPMREPREAAEAIRGWIGVARPPGASAWAEDAVADASRLVYESLQCAAQALHPRACDDPGLAKMGTSASMVLLQGNFAVIGQVGDSRVYLARGEQLIQLTEDHTLRNAMIRGGHAWPETGQRSALSRSIGCRPTVAADVMALPLVAGDRLLLCTDGLHSTLTEDDLLALFELDVADAALAAIRRANALGGPDNVTAIFVELAA